MIRARWAQPWFVHPLFLSAVEVAIVSHAIAQDRPILEIKRTCEAGPEVANFLHGINVLENAAKFSASSEIELRAFRKDRFVAFEVLDSGPGFSEEALANLFEKFSRGQESDGCAPGVGLGLAIAKGFLTAQGGSIIAANRTDGRGASVTLLLPVAEG